MKIYKICFSPTGGTEKVAGFIAAKLGSDIVNINLTDRKADFKGVALNGDDVAVIAVPSYGGRVPAPAAERITQISGNGARAVIVCVYGNRAYEDTLAELQDCALKAGFSIVAAVAAIAEHSIVRRYAANRPDQDDYTALNKYAEQIAAKLNSNDSATPAIPGNRPYKKAGSVGFVPRPTAQCTSCGLCASKCPTGAISTDNPAKVDKKACISCMRCAAICPHGARKVNRLLLSAANIMLKKVCSTRKECELYI